MAKIDTSPDNIRRLGTLIAQAKAGEIYQIGRQCFIIYTNHYAGCVDRISPRQSLPLTDGTRWTHPYYKHQ